MKIVIELRDSAGEVVGGFVIPGAEASVAVGGQVKEVGITVEEVVGDEFVAAHLDEIIAVAAAGMAWRDEARKPHPDQASQKASFKAFIRYTTVLDTISPEVKGWLMMHLPKTNIKIMEGG